MAEKPRILVVDDEPVVRESLREWFASDGYPIEMAESAREALQKMQESSWDILLTDVKMPGMDGLELQKKAKEVDPDITVIIMTAYASVDSAMQAIKEGAYDYVTKPLDPDDLEQTINRVAEFRELRRENRQIRERLGVAGEDRDELIGESPEVRGVREQILEAAATEDSVLVTGETGTGKGVVARAIHRLSPRGHMPLVTLNHTGLPDDRIEDELFGHERGAYPGAEFLQKGKLELADGSSVLFRDIGGFSLEIQSHLLRVIDGKGLTRIGGSEAIPVDFRLLAASNGDLGAAVAGGRFERELYRRIAERHIELPPLRERRSDIPMLIEHFLGRMIAEKDVAPVRVSPSALRRLIDYEWPGNIGQLERVLERAARLHRGAEISPDDLQLGATA